MSSSRSFLVDWMVGLLFLFALGFAGWAIQQRRQAQAATAELVAAQASLETSIKHTQARIDRQQRDEAAKAAAAASARAAAAPKAPAPPDFGAIISSHPELLAIFVKAIRGMTDQTYGPLFARLHLSTDQIDKLKSLIVNDLEGQLDLNSTAQSQGLSNDDSAITKMREQQKSDLQAAEQALLGPDAYAAFHTAGRAEAMRASVNEVAYMTQFTAAPLTGDQSQQLVQLMAQASGDFRDGKDANPRAVDWDLVMAQAPAFLAPSQLAALQGMAQENRFRALARQFDAEQKSAAPAP